MENGSINRNGDKGNMEYYEPTKNKLKQFNVQRTTQETNGIQNKY